MGNLYECPNYVKTNEIEQCREIPNQNWYIQRLSNDILLLAKQTNFKLCMRVYSFVNNATFAENA